ncbi:MAG: glycosyltransferase family 4 protein [Methylocystis sp.]|jgi:glycosyltransferase involved in cell wall biosynthesis|nr:glycosyltransferase family 4 protein [Methylocystis sp.]MCA3587492.1 glycosyltransferase family 4 protein [Methylocystis sp.]MCA3591017.1 glycosyltransferase family 4 protein [Methylocystis sp.]
MRVLMVNSFYESHCGGLEVVAGAIARGLAAQGHDTVWAASNSTEPPASVLNLTAQGYTTIDPGTAIGVPLPVPSPGAIGLLWRALKGADAVVVHDCLYLPVIATFCMARLRRKPVLIIQHIGEVPYTNILLRTLMRIANATIARPMLARAEQVIFISAATEDYFADVAFQAPPEVIFNGVDANVFAFRPGCRADWRRRFGFGPSQTVALFVGRFVEKKGLAVLREMASSAPDVTFAFAGEGPIEPRQWNLHNVAVFKDLRGADIAALYHAADALVLPSVGEGYPLVVQEALACGLPVVCSREIGDADPHAARVLTLVERLRDPADNAAAFMLALRQAVAADDVHKAAERSAFALARYSWDRMTERLSVHLTRVVRANLRDGGVAVPAR